MFIKHFNWAMFISFVCWLVGLFYVYECLSCMYMFFSWYQMRPEEYHGIGVTDGCNIIWIWGVNSGLLSVQAVVITTVPSLQPQFYSLYWVIFILQLNLF